MSLPCRMSCLLPRVVGWAFWSLGDWGSGGVEGRRRGGRGKVWVWETRAQAAGHAPGLWRSRAVRSSDCGVQLLSLPLFFGFCFWSLPVLLPSSVLCLLLVPAFCFCVFLRLCAFVGCALPRAAEWAGGFLPLLRFCFCFCCGSFGLARWRCIRARAWVGGGVALRDGGGPGPWGFAVAVCMCDPRRDWGVAWV